MLKSSHYKQAVLMSAIAAAAWMFSSPAYAPPGGKPKVADDVQCNTPCVDNSEIQGPVAAEKLDPIVTAPVIRDRDGKFVAKLAGSALVSQGAIAGTEGEVAVLYRGDPEDAGYFGTHPFVMASLVSEEFVGNTSVNFEFSNCDDTGNMYINATEKVVDRVVVAVINDPNLGAVMYVPTLPVTFVDDASVSSSLGASGACSNFGPTARNGTLAEPIELGFFPPYSLGD